ncbi:MAG: transketolase [Nocardiopsaceae bacterium]|jgi:transketolase|nr:transketolase [Nocardiopsaceae bacterium]
MGNMRERFARVATELLDSDGRLAVVLADISADLFEAGRRRHPNRVINLGIREQLLISVAGGMSLAGMRPIAHTFASFLIERPFEQIKLDLNHQAASAGAILVSSGGSFDYSASGRTHQSPGDVALLGTLPGWTVHVPGHADEAEPLLRSAAAADDLVYLRLSALANAAPLARRADGFTVLRRGSEATVLAVGPLADEVIAATTGMDVTVLYAPTIRPFDRQTLRATLSAPVVVLAEPYLAGTSVPEVAVALADLPHRVLGLGVGRTELRHYGTPQEHQAAHGLDATSLREQIAGFIGIEADGGGRLPARSLA